MKAPSSAREALIAEAIGDAGRLLDRVDAATKTLGAATDAFKKANTQLEAKLVAFEHRMEVLKTAGVEYAAQQISTRATKSMNAALDENKEAMKDAAQVLFKDQVGATLQSLTRSLKEIVDRANQPWYQLSLHAGTASASSMLTWLAIEYFSRH